MIRVFIAIAILLAGCQQSGERGTKAVEISSVKHASTFHFEKDENAEYLVVKEPWPNSTEQKRYALGQTINKVVCTSTSHLPYFEILGLEDLVVGFPNVSYISSDVFQNKVSEGSLIDLGTDGSINLELLIGLDPDAIIAFDAGGESTTLKKIEDLGIPVIYNSDFLEETPLGRAEWIKVFGALFNKRSEADSIFSSIENEYDRLKDLVKNVSYKPTILSGVVYGDTWFLPGGRNWSSTFFKNAGGHYLWESDSSSGWLELSFEAVYEHGNDADFWIGVSTFEGKAEMEGQEGRYASFDAFKEDQVYNFNKKKGSKGGFDIFESGYSRPDLVLSDLIKVLHPEILPEYETVYFKQLQ